MEARFSLLTGKPSAGPHDLLRAAESAQVHAFGWPIGVVLTRDDAAPKPRADGIAAEIIATVGHSSYDYWALRRNGDFYLVHTLFEDGQRPGANLVVLRLAHRAHHGDAAVLPPPPTIALAPRRPRRSPSSSSTVALPDVRLHRRIRCAICPWTGSQLKIGFGCVQTTLEGIETELTAVVKTFVAPLFEMFDYFVLSDKVLSDIVDGFVGDVRMRG